MISKKMALLVVVCGSSFSLFAAQTDADQVVGQSTHALHKINLKRVAAAQGAATLLVGQFKLCRAALVLLAASGLGYVLYRSFYPSAVVPEGAVASVPLTGPALSATNQLVALSEGEFRQKIDERLKRLESYVTPQQVEEKISWWRRAVASYFEQAKVLSWAAFYYVLQTATSSMLISGIDRVVPLAEIWSSVPSLQWFILNKTSFLQNAEAIITRVKEGVEEGEDYGLWCRSIEMLVYDVENIMGYLRCYLVFVDSEPHLKKFLQDMISRLHSATDELVDAAERSDYKKVLLLMERIRRIIKNGQVACAG